MRVPVLLVELDRLLEEPARRVRVSGPRGHRARSVEQHGPFQRVLHELRCLLEVTPRLRGRGERLGPLSGPHEHGPRLTSDLGRVLRVRGSLVGCDVMRCDDLDHIVFVAGERAAEVLGCGQMTGAPLTLGERLVGDVAHEVLEEGVLPVLGRAGLCLHAEHLLARKSREQRLDLGVGACKRGQCVLREGLAQNGRVLEQLPLLGREAVEPGGDERVQRLRHFERLHRPRHPVGGAFLDKEAAVEQHAHGLDRVQRDAFGAREDAVADVRGKPRHQACQELLHRLRR